MKSSKKREIHPFLSSPKKKHHFPEKLKSPGPCCLPCLRCRGFLPIQKWMVFFNSPVLQQKSNKNPRKFKKHMNFFEITVDCWVFFSHVSKCKMNHHISFIDSFISPVSKPTTTTCESNHSQLGSYDQEVAVGHCSKGSPWWELRDMPGFANTSSKQNDPTFCTNWLAN